MPHYLGAAVGLGGRDREAVGRRVGVGVILGVARSASSGARSSTRSPSGSPRWPLFTHLLLVALGLAFVFSPSDLADVDLGASPPWGDLAFALALATLAYTGLETVANLAAEAREPGKTLPRSLFVGIGLVVLVTTAIGLVSVSVPGVSVELQAPLIAIVDALEGAIPAWAVDALAHLRRAGRGRRPRRRDHHVDLRRRPAGVRAGAARHAPARVRAA